MHLTPEGRQSTIKRMKSCQFFLEFLLILSKIVSLDFIEVLQLAKSR